MIKFENAQFSGFEPAVRGMRNPMNSWDRSDSMIIEVDGMKGFMVGEDDLQLMNKLFKAGTEHRKFSRMIIVWLDITAPLYWWKEFDTYKVGTVANSCSTMHKIHAKEFTLDDFSHDHLNDVPIDVTYQSSNGICVHLGSKSSYEHLIDTIALLNCYRERFLKDRNKADWWNMIQLLPSSYNQKRTVMMNYEVCARIIGQRTGHKLDEWNQFVDFLKGLPHLQNIMDVEENE